MRLGQAASANRFNIDECRAKRNVKTIEREERVCICFVGENLETLSRPSGRNAASL